jgi:hypothetical protein
MTDKVWSNVAINYENDMTPGCWVDSLEESYIFQYIFHLRYSMYGGLY